MKKKYKILVFPCGSEIGLEIHRSLKFSSHVELYGANSVEDHGKFVYENYIGNVPFVNDDNFISTIKELVDKYDIDAVFPAMDSVIAVLSDNEKELGCKVLGSPGETNKICLSKGKTYKLLKDTIRVPKLFDSLNQVQEFPVFMKPDIGYGSRGTRKIFTVEEGNDHIGIYPDCLIMENLPGSEYTIDCFTDKNGELLFSRGRMRRRISNGISVNTLPVIDKQENFEVIANKINGKIELRGAWFFQLKEAEGGELCLLEVASRLGGSSSLFRNLGINFALLTIFDAFDQEVKIFQNNYNIEMDRALSSRFKLDITFKNVYIDFDDCLIINNVVNYNLVALIYQFLNEGKRIILITKHDRVIQETLKSFRLDIFDEIIHLDKSEKKYLYVMTPDSIFIDDSYSERKEIHEKLGIPVFAPDNIECLIK